MKPQDATYFIEGELPAITLRPLSTGEILDRTFALYRSRFWLFAGIGILPAAAMLLGSIGRLLYVALTHREPTLQPGASPEVFAHAVSNLAVLQIYLLPATLLFLVAYGISHAATTMAVSSATQGGAIDVVAAYRATFTRWARWFLIALRQLWSFLWPMLPPAGLFLASIAIPGIRGNLGVFAGIAFVSWVLLVAAFVLGLMNYLRNALAIPASVLEGVGVQNALLRSRILSAGCKGKIFLVLLLVYALQMVVGGIQVPLLLLATTTRGAEHIVLQGVQLLVQFLAVLLVSPVASIALCLLYVDERVRREGYDIELLMRRNFSRNAMQASPVATDTTA